jgi:hypothetical protein
MTTAYILLFIAVYCATAALLFHTRARKRQDQHITERLSTMFKPRRREPNCLNFRHWRELSDRAVFDRAEDWLDFVKLMECGEKDEWTLRKLMKIQETAGCYYAAAVSDLMKPKGEEK